MMVFGEQIAESIYYVFSIKVVISIYPSFSPFFSFLNPSFSHSKNKIFLKMQSWEQSTAKYDSFIAWF